MDNQCANIFSTHATVYGLHSAIFAFYCKREYFFLHVYPQLSFFFKTWFVSFYLSPTPLFFLKTVFPIFIGGEIFFNLCSS